MAHKVICDKCGVESLRQEAKDWSLNMSDQNSYGGIAITTTSFSFSEPTLDLCPTCFKEYQNIVMEADAHKKELICNWLRAGK